MDEKMLIEAMRQMMREEIGREVGKALEPIREDIQALKADQRGDPGGFVYPQSRQRGDPGGFAWTLKADNAEIREDLQSVKADTARLVTMEKTLGLLMDAQVETRDKVKRLDKVADDVEEIKVKVAALESVTKENTSQIKDIRLAK